MKMDGLAALNLALQHRAAGRFPNREDVRQNGQHLFPYVTPSFKVKPGERIFTIGSCFARNIEDFLTDFDVPTSRFAVDKVEWASRPNGLLNEYNAGTIAQRLTWASEGRHTADMPKTLVGAEDSTLDLLLPVSPGVARTRAIQRRGEIDAVYAQLPQSQVIVLTLGLTECWYDNETSTYLNRMPPRPDMSGNPGRYSFVNLELDQCVDLLDKALKSVTDRDDCKVILTVSPVPLQTTFTGQDCVTANARSKAVLRAAADQLCRGFAGRVDYFPSYEIVMSGGQASFGIDNVHVYPQVVEKIMDHLFANYVDGAAASAGVDASGAAQRATR